MEHAIYINKQADLKRHLPSPLLTSVVARPFSSVQRKAGSPAVQRRIANHAEPTAAPPVVHEVLRSPGQPLDATTRAFMEPRFGHDFSRVRVHTDAMAAESAQAVNALAYTVGQDIVFDNGAYAPIHAKGQRLLAHELVHTIQQLGGDVSPRGQLSALRIGESGDNFERRAEAFSNRVGDGEKLWAADYTLVDRSFNTAQNLLLQRAEPQGEKTPPASRKTKSKSKSADGCKFTLEIGMPVAERCEYGGCGSIMLIPLVRLNAEGGGCPPLAGQRLTETVDDERLRPEDKSCGPALIRKGEGCTMDSKGFFTDCVDRVAVCGGIGDFPEGTCTRRIVQRYMMGNTVIAENHYVDRVKKWTESGVSKCKGSPDFIPGDTVKSPDR